MHEAQAHEYIHPVLGCQQIFKYRFTSWVESGEFDQIFPFSQSQGRGGAFIAGGDGGVDQCGGDEVGGRRTRNLPTASSEQVDGQ